MDNSIEKSCWSITRTTIQNEMHDVLKSPTNGLYQIRKWTDAGWSSVYMHTAMMCTALNYYRKKDPHEAELELHKNHVVWENNPGGEDPTFTQGSAQAPETAAPVTAERCAAFVSEIQTLTAELYVAGDDIVALKKQIKNLFGEKKFLKEKIISLMKALEESVPAKPSAEADWNPARAPLGVMPFHIWGYARSAIQHGRCRSGSQNRAARTRNEISHSGRK